MTRLPDPWGRRIDRTRPIRFRFEGREIEGLAGDSVASALAAAGQWMLSRSFKYHRPRGILSMAEAEANTLVQLPGMPNMPAEGTAIRDGLDVRAQNVRGSLAHDRGAVIDRLGSFLPVGFYYRSFIGPGLQGFRRLWEPLIRRSAGLGVIDPGSVRDHFTSAYLHCELLVVGGGLAGLSAALTAARAGADVILCDDQPELGGAETWRRSDGTQLTRLVAEARRQPGLRLFTQTRCNGWFEDNWLALIHGNHLLRTRAREVIFAPGTIGQPAVFRNNDLPGVMLGSAVQRLMRHYAVRPGQRAVVLAATREGYCVALDLLDAGVELAAVIDPRPDGSGGELAASLREYGVEMIAGVVSEARGKHHLRAVKIGARWIDCDLLAVSVGEAPAWQLPCQAGATLGYDAVTARFNLALPEGPLGLAGAVNGRAEAGPAIADGARAAGVALKRLGRAVAATEAGEDTGASRQNYVCPIEAHPAGRDFVDFDEDLQVKDLIHSVQEGYRELELLKRFSALGMGPSQGRHSALAGTRILAAATDRSLGELGVTTARPPVGPEPLGLLAGHPATIDRRTALHNQHRALGARMAPAGAWWRPFRYGSDPGAVAHEVAAVRSAAGVLDVSTLGKLEIRGPEAGVFLDRLYTMRHSTQPVGAVRYCLMLNEMATVIDDGVAYRLAEDRYYVTATTGAVARVYANMLFWNAQWRMQVDVLNLTSAFAALNVTGPSARAVLAAAGSSLDLGSEAFPHLRGRQGAVAGVPVWAMRIGFTGEVSFELHCPASRAVPLWRALLSAGQPFGLMPYGLEASRILRLEKGHIIIGQDTDALTTPDEAGMGWAVSKAKPFFIGKRALELRRRVGLDRRLVGLTFPEDAREFPGEGCLVLRGEKPVGHITSIARSGTLGREIALGYVHPEDAIEGTEILVKCRSGGRLAARVVSQAFYDPDGRRQEL